MITENMTLGEVAALPQFAGIGHYLMECRPSSWEKFSQIPLMGRMLKGLRRMDEILEKGIQVGYCFWDSDECFESSGRENARLFYFPGKSGAPFVLLFPGGGYQSVCSAAEGFPAAAELNEAGYNAFVLSYRVREHSQMPKPLEDAYRALKFIFDNAEKFQIGKKYAVMGFSAGGHLAGECCTDNHGFMTQGLPAPDAMILCYSAIDLRTIGGNVVADNMIQGLIPPTEEIESYCINLHLDHNCPPTCFWQCEDDDTISFENYHLLCEALEKANVLYEAFSYPIGGHGMMNPHPAEQDNWMEKIINFLYKNGF